ncbi:hypothetical protein Pelo_1219 [Pelomyxa schiedti]|nr:hypothetical protein Pelo_1219 [Pelomyxa schiedti]
MEGLGLPRAVFRRVCEMLSDGGDLLSLCLVCTGWRNFMNDEGASLFRTLLEWKWPQREADYYERLFPALKKLKQAYLHKKHFEQCLFSGRYVAKNVKSKAKGTRLMREPSVSLIIWDAEPGCVEVWNCRTMKCVQRLCVHPPDHKIWWLNVAPSGVCVTACEDHTLNVIDVNNLSAGVSKTLHGHTGSVWCVDVCPEWDRVVSGSSNGELFFWQLSSGKILQRQEGNSFVGWYDVRFCGPNKQWVTGATKSTLPFFMTATGEPAFTLGREKAPLHYLATLPVGDRYLYTSDSIRTVCQWDLQTQTLLHLRDLGGASEATDFYDGKLFCAVSLRLTSVIMILSMDLELLASITITSTEVVRLYTLDVRESALVCSLQSNEIFVVTPEPANNSGGTTITLPSCSVS